MGYIVSLLWYWSAKGYYFWAINFISLVNHYEKEVLKFRETERVYFVFANKETQNNYKNPISGANISTSKVAILFAFIVTMVWGLILIIESRQMLIQKYANEYVSLNLILLGIGVLIFGVIPFGSEKLLKNIFSVTLTICRI